VWPLSLCDYAAIPGRLPDRHAVSLIRVPGASRADRARSTGAARISVRSRIGVK